MNEDYQRLDWLEEVSNDITIEIRFSPYLDHGRWEVKIGRAAEPFHGPSLRAAIDAAMKAIR